MFELIKVTIALVGSAICGLYDLKTTDMLDSLAIGMIISGIGLHAYESFLLGSFNPLINSLTVGSLFLLFGLIMYYLGYWGGGDGELLVAIGVLLPYNPGFSFTVNFPLSFFINTFFIGGLYSIIYALIFSMRNKKIKKKFVKIMNRDKKTIVLVTGFTFISFSVLSLFFGQFLFSLIITILVFLLLVTYRFSKVVEKGFYRKISVSKLREGDMIGEDIPKLKIFKKIIRGLNKGEVEKIKKIKKYVIIREGVRYGPVFSLALLFTLIYGDVFTLFLIV